MKFFFFDLDGTLEDSRKDMVAAAQRVREFLKLSFLDFETLVPHVNKGMRELYLNCFDDFVREADSKNISEDRVLIVQKLYEQTYAEAIAVNTVLYPGIHSALEDAKKMGRLAVITNKPEHLSIRLLDSLGILPLIDLVVGGDTCHEAKPSPVPLQYALEKLGGRRPGDQVFMVGDSQGDARAGALCGATTIWCAWGYQSQAPNQPEPHHQVATPEELKIIFQ